MKTTSFYIQTIVICITLSLFSLNAQNASDSLYNGTMSHILTKLDSATTVKDFQFCKSQLERLTHLSESHTMPTYYIAYCDIRSVFADPKSKNNTLLLDEAKQYIDKLKVDTNADRSEIETLSGFYYMALIVSDPANNGQKYYQEVIQAYQEAIKLNADNPRPICLLIFFEQQLPPFLRSNKDNKDAIAIAQFLFDKETHNINTPYWGKEYLDRINSN